MKGILAVTGLAMVGAGAYLAFFHKKEEDTENKDGLKGLAAIRAVLAPTPAEKMAERESTVSNQVNMTRLY